MIRSGEEMLNAEETGLLGWVMTSLSRADAAWLLERVEERELLWGASKAIYRAVAACLTRNEVPDRFRVTDELVRAQQWEEKEAVKQVGRCMVVAIEVPFIAAGAVKIVKERAAGRDLHGKLMQYAAQLVDGAETQTVRGALLAELTALSTRREGVTLNEALDTEVARLQAGKAIPAVFSGIGTLDRKAGGLENGQVGVIAGDPGSGKSVLAVQVARYGGNEYGPGVVISLEMSEDQIARRVLSGATGVDYRHLREAGRDGVPFNEWDLEHFTKMSAERGKTLHPVHLNTAAYRMSELVAALHGYRHEHGIQWALIDYGQLLTEDRKKAQSKAEEMSGVARALKKEIADPLSIPLWVLLQPTQEAGKRGGFLKVSDLAWSQEWRAVASQIWLLNPDTEDPGDDDWSGTVLDIAKSRNGALGKVRLIFNKAQFEFCARETERTERDAPPERSRYGND